jgi:hypothetical protein
VRPGVKPHPKKKKKKKKKKKNFSPKGSEITVSKGYYSQQPRYGNNHKDVVRSHNEFYSDFSKERKSWLNQEEIMLREINQSQKDNWWSGSRGKCACLREG